MYTVLFLKHTSKERRCMTIFVIQVNYMLTPKDILYLQDVLDQTLVLHKRIQHELPCIQNEEVSQCFTNVQDKLKEHYDTLLNILESEAK